MICERCGQASATKTTGGGAHAEFQVCAPCWVCAEIPCPECGGALDFATPATHGAMVGTPVVRKDNSISLDIRLVSFYTCTECDWCSEYPPAPTPIVTFPARQFSLNGARHSYALLRPITEVAAQSRIRDLILDAYRQHEADVAALDAAPLDTPLSDQEQAALARLRERDNDVADAATNAVLSERGRKTVVARGIDETAHYRCEG